MSYPDKLNAKLVYKVIFLICLVTVCEFLNAWRKTFWGMFLFGLGGVSWFVVGFLLIGRFLSC